MTPKIIQAIATPPDDNGDSAAQPEKSVGSPFYEGKT
jgi:hypothetical protein